MAFSAQHIKAARRHLQQSDPIMKSIIRAVGPFTEKARRDRFLMLVRSILAQQISGAAARTIQGRLIDAVAPDKITPESVSRFSLERLRAIGISRQKATYLLDLADNVQRGMVDLSGIGRRTDQEIIAELTRIKGIGVWTAQMFMMFSLGRLDVFPADDLGIQNGIKLHYPVRGKLTKTTMERIARPWRPYATVASWYLWRSLALEKKEEK